MTLRRITILAALLAALSLIAGTFVCAATPAGTNITAQATATYNNSAGAAMPTATSNSVTVKVDGVGGVGISVPGGTTQSFTTGQPGGLAFTVNNTGNAAGTFSVSATSDNTAVTVQVVLDANGDGILQSTETTAVSTTSSINAGASAKLIAKLSASAAQSANVTLTAKSTADATKIATANVAITFGTSTSRFIRDWLINGAHSNTDRATRLSRDYMGMEGLCAPKIGDTEGGKVWSAYQSPIDDVDLAEVFPSITNAVAYACVYVNAPVAGDALLKMGSDDGIKAWMNGELVWTNDTFRDCIPDSDSVPVKLTQGWNRLLVKVSQDLEGWGFCVRVADTAGNPIPGLTTSIDTGDRVPPAISNLKVSSVTTSEAVVEWDTDEPGTTEVGYGILSTDELAYGDPAFTTHHTAKLTNLKASTTYQVKVYSADMQNNIGTANAITFSTSDNPSEPEPPVTTFVTDWAIHGYYANSDKATRLSRNYLPSETSIYPYPGYTTNSKAWTKVVAASTGKVDLLSAFGSRTNCAAYAHVYFYSPVAQTVNVLVGSDDGVKIWLNGVVAWNNDVYRGFTADQDKFQVNLHAGWSRMLVKLSQGSGAWGFSLRFTNQSGNPVENLTIKPEKPW